MNEREKRLLMFLAERHRAWATCYTRTDDDPGYGEGYDAAKNGAADDIETFMLKEYDADWIKAKVEAA